ncbi:MAG: transcription factor [Candidatus Lokiarchaeota archaeon]|nr:transcription factor [Candidatus Lokiarchaeota archaeon]
MTKWHKIKKMQDRQKASSGQYTPKQLKRMMKKGGMPNDMDVNEIENVEKVVIYTDKEEIIIENPQGVTQMFLPQGEVFQIMGSSTKLSQEEGSTEEPEFQPSIADVQIVIQQTGATQEDAEKALKENEGNIAKAILSLK